MTEFADLPAHTYIEGVCTFCGETRETETYDEYVAWWEANEYEGEPYHEPIPTEEWEYLRSTCLRIQQIVSPEATCSTTDEHPACRFGCPWPMMMPVPSDAK